MVAAIAAPHGLAILAPGTHPTAAWTKAQQTKAEPYDTIMYDLQMIGRRNMLCGLHVHVELPDPDARVDVMTRMLPYLPIFIALATSRRSGSRNAPACSATGSPLMTSCRAPACPSCSVRGRNFEAYVDVLVRAGVLPRAHHVGRRLAGLGHDVRLIPATCEALS